MAQLTFLILKGGNFLNDDFIKKIGEIFINTGNRLANGYIADKEMLKQDLLIAERTVLQLRKYYFQYTVPMDYFLNHSSEFGVRLDILDGFYQIELPPLINKRWKNELNNFPFDALYWVLFKNLQDNLIKKYEKAGILFVHHYSNPKSIFDYDNLESKKIIDILSMFFLEDDNMKYLTVSHKSVESTFDYVDIYIYPDTPEDFKKIIGRSFWGYVG